MRGFTTVGRQNDYLLPPSVEDWLPESHLARLIVKVRVINHLASGLKSHSLEYVWGGVTALTRNGATFFGKAKTGLYASVGCNGAGVLKGSMYGKLLAEMIMGSQSRELSDALSLEAPSWLPPEPLRRLAVTAAIRRQKAKAGLQF